MVKGGESVAEKRRKYAWWIAWIGGAGALLTVTHTRRGDVFFDSVFARAGSAASVKAAGKAEALRLLLQNGASFRVALSIRRLIEAGFPADEALPVISTEFERWTGRSTASWALAKTGPPAIPWLVATLRSDKVRTRQQGALALGDIGGAAESALPALQQLASGGLVDDSIVAAREAIPRIAPRNANDRLAKAWFDSNGPALFVIFFGLCAIALVAYGRMKGRRIIPAESDARTPRWFLTGVVVLGVALFAFALVDLLGARWTTQADTLALAYGAWLFVGALLA